jgi:hypothetical protein
MSISFKFAQGTLALGQSKLDCLASLGMTATAQLTRDDSSGALPKACKGGLDANPNPSLKDKKLVFPVADYWGLRSTGYHTSDANYFTWEVLFRGQPYTVTCSRAGAVGSREVFRPVSIIKIPALTVLKKHAEAAAQPAVSNQPVPQIGVAPTGQEDFYMDVGDPSDIGGDFYANLPVNDSPNPIVVGGPGGGVVPWQPLPDQLPLGRRHTM